MACLLDAVANLLTFVAFVKLSLAAEGQLTSGAAGVAAFDVQPPLDSSGERNTAGQHKFQNLWKQGTTIWRHRTTDPWRDQCNGYRSTYNNASAVVLESSAIRGGKLTYGDPYLWEYGPEDSMWSVRSYMTAIMYLKFENNAHTCAVVVAQPWWTNSEREKDKYVRDQEKDEQNCTVITKDHISSTDERECLIISKGNGEYMVKGTGYYDLFVSDGENGKVPHDCDAQYKAHIENKPKQKKKDKQLYDASCKSK